MRIIKNCLILVSVVLEEVQAMNTDFFEALRKYGWLVASRAFTLVAWIASASAILALHARTKHDGMFVAGGVLILLIIIGFFATLTNAMVFFQDRAVDRSKSAWAYIARNALILLVAGLVISSSYAFGRELVSILVELPLMQSENTP